MSTRDTAARVRGVSRCAKNQNRTRNRGTRFKSTAGLPVPVLNPNKGRVMQNCLAACNFNLGFIYIFSGWECSTTDSVMFNDARLIDLHILPRKYYLADAGFPSSLGTVIPYWGIHYHLAKWGHAGLLYVVSLFIMYQTCKHWRTFQFMPFKCLQHNLTDLQDPEEPVFYSHDCSPL